MAKRRRREIQKLSKEQEREEQLLMKNVDKSTNTKGLVEVSLLTVNLVYLACMIFGRNYM